MVRAALARRFHVSLLTLPDAMLSTVSGIYDVLGCLDVMDPAGQPRPEPTPFDVDIVSLRKTFERTASGLSVTVHRSLREIARTDIVIVPAMMVAGGEWVPGRYPEVVAWLSRMHRGGAMLCSACSGVLLLAETGLLDGNDATIHWAYARTFRRHFPAVRLQVERVLVTTGTRQEFVMSGASASWHDLVLYLVSRKVGPAAAQSIAKFMLLQWHGDGQALYAAFDPPSDHGDATVLTAQEWLGHHFADAAPVEAMIRQSGLPERSFHRRFKKATGFSPLEYVQRVRIDKAKYRLERTDDPVDQVGWTVGYEEPAFFRRLFKRLTRVTPGAYRRKLRAPVMHPAPTPPASRPPAVLPS